jgi:hypothetical protein
VSCELGAGQKRVPPSPPFGRYDLKGIAPSSGLTNNGEEMYETHSDLIVFVKWFDRVSVAAVTAGDALKARQAARGMAHFLRRLYPDLSTPESSFSTPPGDPRGCPR